MSQTPGTEPDLPEDIGAVDPDDPAGDIEALPAEEQIGDDEGSDPDAQA